jgi:PadR family transcriptional regulator PadR
MPGQFLAEFELYVMLAIARLGDDAYGASIRRDIEGRTGRPVSVGALYATLARLGDKKNTPDGSAIAGRSASP